MTTHHKRFNDAPIDRAFFFAVFVGLLAAFLMIVGLVDVIGWFRP